MRNPRDESFFGPVLFLRANLDHVFLECCLAVSRILESPVFKYYSRWKTIRPIIEGETTFRSTNEESERRQLFETNACMAPG
jgi:hypothetical protein